MATQIEAYKCPECGKIHETERKADFCHYQHLKQRCINHDWEAGLTLSFIANRYGFRWKLSDRQSRITKDSCFKISHLQCCDKPAYRLTRIALNGDLHVWGRGGWMGGFGSTVRLDLLADPRPASELFVYEESKAAKV